MKRDFGADVVRRERDRDDCLQAARRLRDPRVLDRTAPVEADEAAVMGRSRISAQLVAVADLMSGAPEPRVLGWSSPAAHGGGQPSPRDGTRRATMVATVVLACGAWTLVRTEGITGDVVSMP